MTSEHDDFWGDSADWPTAQHPIQQGSTDRRADPGEGRSRSRITGRHRLSGFLDRGTAPTREHRVVDDAAAADDAAPTERGGAQAPPSYAYGADDDAFDWDFAEPAPGRTDAASAAGAVGGPPPSGEPPATEWGEEWEVSEPRSRAAMIDPLLARVGAAVVAITLAVPVLLGFRSDSDPAETLREAQAELPPSEVAGAAAPTTVPTTAADQGTSGSNEVAGSTSASAEVTASGGSTSAEPVTSTQATTAAATVATDAAAAADPGDGGATASVAVCATEYDVVEGDFWLRLADGGGVSLADLLAVNGATVDTPLYPGTAVCLPAGAATPPPPPATTAAPTTAAPTTAAPTTAAPTTAAPTTVVPTTAAPTTPSPTTAAPTTAAPTTPTPPSPPVTGSVEDIIRAVWPDELEERALEIARRESNLQPDVRNYCCIGLFQIYWEVHRSWLSGMGITTLEHLYDAETNARAAYALYQRSGGWGPWGG